MLWRASLISFSLLTISDRLDYPLTLISNEYGKVFWKDDDLHHPSMENEMARSRQMNSIPIQYGIFRFLFWKISLYYYKLQNWMKVKNRRKKSNKTRISPRPKWKRSISQQFNIFHAELCYGWFCVQFTCKKNKFAER